jgi:phage terminase large subunit-like protein
MPDISADRTKAYAKAVVAGKIVAGPHVRNACRRHLKDLTDGKRRGLVFDQVAAAHAIGFFEDMLRLSEGQFEGEPFLLQPPQAFIVGSIFGWKVRHPKHGLVRRFRSAFIEMGKGAGKSPLAAGIGLYGMTADNEAGAEIYPLASHRDQALILFRDAVKMTKKSPALSKRLRFSGGEDREWNIAHLASGSFMRPLSRDAGKTGSGPRPHMGLADEIHEMTSRAALDMTEAGFKFRRQPLLLMITNSGSDRNSIAWEKHEHAIVVAAGNPDNSPEALANPVFLGEPIDDTFFSYCCALDADDDPLEDPTCWIKANPLLGTILTEEYIASVVAQAKMLPGKLNGILRLNFCVWTDAATAWMPRKVLEPCYADFDPKIHEGKEVFVGCDLSQNRDITALAVVVKTGEIDVESERDGRTQIVSKPTYDAWVEAWTPGDTADERSKSDKTPYDRWIASGHLNGPKGQSIRFDHVAQALAEFAHEYDIKAVAYDRYSFKRGFEPECDKLGLSLPFIEHPQGGVKKGKPTDDMIEAAKAEGREPEGLWMPGSLRELEDALLEGRIRMRRNPVLISAMASAATDEDRWGNHWLAKERASKKIDCAIALCMAVGAAKSVTTVRRDYQMIFLAA